MRNRIETERLVLRPFETQDLSALVLYAGDYDVAKATGQLPHPYTELEACLLYTSPSPRDQRGARMPSSA